METSEIKIFLIEPNNKSKYETFIVYSDSEEDARHDASTKINLMEKTKLGSATKQLDTVYIDETLSACLQIDVTVLNVSNKTVQIKYLGNKYILYKGFAMPLQSSNTAPS